MPRIAVVMATWERPAFLEEAFASVRRQTVTDWECVIVDDGSRDDTPVRLARLAAEDSRLRWLSLSHSGRHGRVRNAGIRASSAPLVAFLDDDDVWPEWTLERLAAVMDAEPETPLACGRMERFGEGRGLWPSRPQPPRLDLQRLLRGNVVPLSAVMARRTALEAAGLFPEDVEATPDYELWLRVARTRPLRALPDVLVRYRVHPGCISRRRALEVEELERLYARLEGEWALPRWQLGAARRGLARARARQSPSRWQSLWHWGEALSPWPR